MYSRKLVEKRINSFAHFKRKKTEVTAVSDSVADPDQGSGNPLPS
jgi:hypothetical protein